MRTRPESIHAKAAETMNAKPHRSAANLDVASVGRGRWALANRHSAGIRLIAFHRALHCPIYRPEMSTLNRPVAEFDRRGTKTPPKLAEQGIFLIRPDRTVYFAAVQSMPFARPQFSEILSAIDFVLEHDYPARGEA
jgi:hypothetical protein